MADDWLVEQIPVGPGLTKKHGRIDVNYADPRRTDPSLTIPAPHGYTHGVDGGDPVQLAMTQVTDLVSTLGDKVDGDDARLSNARTPTAHHATHEDGGSDELTLAQSQISGLAAALADVYAAIASVLPARTMPADAYKVLGVQADGSLVWVTVTGAEFPFNYDAAEDYDSAFTYDEEFIS